MTNDCDDEANGKKPPDDELPLEERLRRAEEPLDYSPASGAVGSEQKEYDEGAPQSNDGRSNTRTKFYAEEADHPSIDYEKLGKINDGMYADDDNKRRVQAELQMDCEIFTDTLNLPTHIRSDVRRLVEEPDDVRPYGSTATLVLAAINLATDDADRTMLSTEEDYYSDDEQFTSLCNDCDVQKERVRKATELLRERVA